jgi:hypothetical protein
MSLLSSEHLVYSLINLSNLLDIFSNFLHNDLNVVRTTTSFNYKPPLFVLVTFLCQRISITLQKMQASSILNQVIAVGLITSQLPPFQNVPPIATIDLLQVVGC